MIFLNNIFRIRVVFGFEEVMTETKNWFKANKLTTNTDKSYFPLFKSSKKGILIISEHIDFLTLDGNLI